MSFQTCCLLSMKPLTHVVVKTISITIGNHNLTSHMMAPKTMPKTTISQNLISMMNMLSSKTFSRPTWRQPKQRLQLQFRKKQCPRHFFMRSNCHPTSATNSTWSGPPGTANPSFAYMELTCQPYLRLWGQWKTIFHVMSHKKRAQIGHVISGSLMFLVHQL